ncbi:MAG: response regulator [Eubacteriales bacterium]
MKCINELNHYNTILESIGDGVISINVKGKVLSFNKAAEKIIGRSREGVIGQDINTIFKIKEKNTNTLYKDFYKKAIMMNKKIGLKKNTVLIKENQEEIYISASISPVKDGNTIKGVIIVFREITKIVQAEQLLVDEYENFKNIFYNYPVGNILVDSNLTVKKINNKALKIFNIKRTEVINKKIGAGINCIFNDGNCGINDKCFGCELNKSMKEIFSSNSNVRGKVFKHSLVVDSRNYNIWIKYHIMPINLNRGQYYILNIEDITEQKMVEEELKKARDLAEEANKAKSQFLANMSHEIRTPLNGLLGMVDLTLKSDLNKKQKTNLEIAKSCSHSLMKVINDVLDLSKIEAGKIVLEYININLTELMNNTIAIHKTKAEEKGLKLSYKIDDNVEKNLVGDPYRLQQILNNIIANAIKFTDEGRVDLLVRQLKKDEKQIKLEFSVKDTGIGISKKDKDKLFKSFSQVDGSITRKYGGTGLGLVISKRLIELMNGKIKMKSEINKGTTFSFTVLFDRKKQKALNDKKEDIKDINVNYNILVIEDDVINQKVIRMLLEEHNCKIDIANNGLEALDILLKNKYDVILMDVQMPELDGIETTKIIRKREKDEYTPIIALTAQVMTSDRDRCIQAGMDDYIAKPVVVNELLFKINSVIKKTNKQFDYNLIKDYNKNNDTDNKTQTEQLQNKIYEIVEVMYFLLSKKDFEKAEIKTEKLKKWANSIGDSDIKRLAFKIQLALRRNDYEEGYSLCKKVKEIIKGRGIINENLNSRR